MLYCHQHLQWLHTPWSHMSWLKLSAISSKKGHPTKLAMTKMRWSQGLRPPFGISHAAWMSKSWCLHPKVFRCVAQLKIKSTITLNWHHYDPINPTEPYWHTIFLKTVLPHNFAVWHIASATWCYNLSVWSFLTFPFVIRVITYSCHQSYIPVLLISWLHQPFYLYPGFISHSIYTHVLC